jgi:nitrogen fixation/metabolism regulation signal transduction histidine kinase
MQAHDLEAPNLNILHEPGGRPRLFLEDDPPIGVEDDPPTSVEYDAPISVMPSDSKRTPSVSVLFVFLFLLLAGVGGAFALRSNGAQATDVIRASALPSALSKPTTPPEGFAEVQQQLKSIAADLSAVRHTLEQQRNTLEQQRNTLEQQSAANHDQLTRIQEQISRQSIALLSSSFLADKPVRTPLPKPAQHPAHVSTQEHSAHVSTQDSSKPIQVAPPLPPKQ